jgi:hypothetical protein
MAAEWVCDLCWFSFSTEEELNQHIAMEQEVAWSIDQDYVPSTYEATA